MSPISTTALSKSLGISSKKLFLQLLESGLIVNKDDAWVLTDAGKQKGGVYKESKRFGQYIVWPEDIEIQNQLTPTQVVHVSVKKEGSAKFREKFKATHRSTDGHFVRSKAEMLIDNWLYMAEIVHAYEKKLPIEEDVYSDFYIPTGKVYIEYWGYENAPKYTARKQKKIELYKKYGFNLIELQDKEVQNLDDVLPKLLLRYGVQTY